MGMNGFVGRTKTLARIKRDQMAIATQAGIDTRDRAAVRQHSIAHSNLLMAGILDRSRCRCGGPKHDVITASRTA